VKTPVTIAPEALDFTRLIRSGETVGWAEATAEPVFLTRLLDAQAERCPPFRLFFALTFSDAFGADHPNVTVTALGGASAGRRFFAGRGDNVIPANISDISGLVSSGRLPIDLVLLQVSGPDATGRYNAGLGIEHLHAAIGRARLVIAQVNPELPWTHGDTEIEPTAIDVLVPAAAHRSMSSGRNWPLHPKTPYCRSPGLPSGCCYFFEPGLGWGCTLLQARQSRFRKAARHSAAEVSLVPSECISISIKAGEYGMGKWISDSRAESGVAVKYRRSSRLCCPDAVAKTAIV
jgi:hypothetical protein